MAEFSDNSALLLIDIQQGFDSSWWGPRFDPGLEQNVVRLLEAFRRAKKPVCHAQHLSRNPRSPLAPGQSGVEFMPFARPSLGERVFQKDVNSAFIGTNLEAVLRENRISDLVIAGITADHCVSTTTRMAANLGFRALVAADATMAHERKSHDGKVFAAELVHSVSLSSLHEEFATVMDTASLLRRLAVPSVC